MTTGTIAFPNILPRPRAGYGIWSWITTVDHKRIGILYGIGMYYAAVLGTLITFGILAVFRWFEDKMPGQFHALHVLRFPKDKTPSEEEVRRRLKKHGFSISNLSYRLDEGGTVFEYRTVIRSSDGAKAGELAEDLRSMEDILEFRISPMGD